MLWVLAGLGVLWVVLPIVMYHLGRTTIRNEIFPGPERAVPRGWDRSYARAFREFTALGFQPVGSTIETTWFLTPMNWRKQFPEAHWLISPDGATFVACYRVLFIENVRLALHSMNDRGGMMMTVSPGAKVHVDPGGADRRLEVPRMDAAALVARHQAEVSAFCQAHAWSVVPATHAEVVDRATNLDRRISRKVVGISFSILPLLVLALPVLDTPGARGLAGGPLALEILSGVGSFALFRVVAVPIGAITVATAQFVARVFGSNR